MQENRSHYLAPGSVRRGRALLAGLVVCGYCGYRLFTRYGGKASKPRYCCCGRAVAYGEKSCQGLSAHALDEEVVRLTLLALEPSALEVSLQVAADLAAQQTRDEASWGQRLERAAYEAQRARRQFDAVEPENRLVARTLEKQWEQKLQVHRALCEEHERFLRERPRLLGPQEQEQIRHLAADLPALWHSPATTDEDRKSILRQVIEKVVVKCEGTSEWCEAQVNWVGGQQTYTRLRRPVARIEQLSQAPAIRELICQARAQGLRAAQIAGELNGHGFRAPDGRPFTASGVRTWMCRYARQRPAIPANLKLGADEWLLQDLCQHLDVSHQTVRGWILRHQVEARQLGGPGGRWVLRVSPQKAQTLMAYRRHGSCKSGGDSPTSGESARTSVSRGAF